MTRIANQFERYEEMAMFIKQIDQESSGGVIIDESDFLKFELINLISSQTSV